jgi:hypothetical protein
LESLQNYTNAVIAFVMYLPVLVIWVASILLIVWVVVKIFHWLIKRFKRKKDNKSNL